MEEEYKQITQLSNLVSDLEKENKELRKELSNLKTTIKDTPNNFDLGEKVRDSFYDWDKPASDEDIEKLKQVLSEQIVEEDSIKVKKYIYESPDGGKTVYRRDFGDYENKTRVQVNWETEKEKMRTNFYDPFSDEEIDETA